MFLRFLCYRLAVILLMRLLLFILSSLLFHVVGKIPASEPRNPWVARAVCKLIPFIYLAFAFYMGHSHTSPSPLTTIGLLEDSDRLDIVFFH